MDLSTIFAFYSPEHGANWALVAAWAIFLFLTKGLWPKLSHRISTLLLKGLNKIPLLHETDLDEYVIEKVEQRIIDLVSSKTSDVKKIKSSFMIRIKEALAEKDYDQVRALSGEMQRKLQALTAEVKDEFIDSEDFFWGLLQDRYGDKIKAGKWVVSKVKSVVHALKDPGDVSTTAIILKHVADAFGDLGNVSLSGRESDG